MHISYVNKKLFWLVLLIILAGCSSNGSAQQVPEAEVASQTDEVAETNSAVSGPVSVVLQNQGGTMEGHTPRGFQGMGTGLFVGDNLNPAFPQGDGVQLFLTFDLSSVPSGEITGATLRSGNGRIQGMPFEDLGTLSAEEVRYDSFSPALWNLSPEPNGASCDFATSAEGSFACDVTATVQRSIEDEYPYAQFRLRLTEAGDSDGQPDMVLFFLTDSNTNQPGIFELELTIGSE